MFRLKTLMFLILVASMILTACGGQATTPPTDVTEAPAATEPPAATEAPADGSSGDGGTCGSISSSLARLRSGCGKPHMTRSSIVGFWMSSKRIHPDVEVEVVEYAPADVYQKLPLALQAGTGAPDISLVENSHLAQIVALGGLTDMTEWVTPYLDKMNAYKWADAKLDDKYYAMPWDSGPVVFYYRRDVFDAAGLPSDPDSVSEAVATWDDYFNVCQTIMEKTGSACFSNNKANNYGRLYEMMLWQQGLGYYNAEGQVTVDSPENIATLEMLKKFWDANLTSDQLEWTDGWYAEMAAETDAKPIATLLKLPGWALS